MQFPTIGLEFLQDKGEEGQGKEGEAGKERWATGHRTNFIPIDCLVLFKFLKEKKCMIISSNTTCHPPDTLHSEMCSACTNTLWCPVRPTKDYCFKAHLAHVTHSGPTVFLCLFTGLWSELNIIVIIINISSLPYANFYMYCYDH